MALLTCDFFSDALQLGTSMTVVLPQQTEEQIGLAGGASEGPPPLLYLLHGLSDDHSAWQRYTAISRYAEKAGLAVVMPAVHRSFYTDEARGHRYWEFLSEELPGIVHEFFRVTDRPEETFVAGLSMGGYGALKLALSHPDRFGAAASLSGALELRELLLAPERRELLERVFGGEVSDDGRRVHPAAAGDRRTSAVPGVRHRGPPAPEHAALRRRGRGGRRRRHPRPAARSPRVGGVGPDGRRRHRLAALGDCGPASGGRGGKRGTSRLIQPSAKRLFRVFCCQPETSPESLSSGPGEERLAYQLVPGPDPGGFMGSLKGAVGVAQDHQRPLEDVLLGVAAAFETRVGDPSSPPEVAPLLSARQVVRSVVLGQPVRAEDSEICARDEATQRIEDEVLGFDRNLARPVKHPEEAFVDRLGAAVHQGNRLSEPRCATSPESGDGRELGLADVAGPEGCVAEDDDVEQTEVASTGEQRLRGTCHAHAVEERPRWDLVVPTDSQSASADAVRATRCHKERQLPRYRRQPPTAQTRCRQTRERRPERQHELPGPERGSLVAHQIGAHLCAGRHRPPPHSPSGATSNVVLHHSSSLTHPGHLRWTRVPLCGEV